MMLENGWRDLRQGFASLWRDPGFSAVAVGVLALGIGANVAMFSLVDAVLLKPLPFPEPDRLVRVWEAPRPGVTNSTSTLDLLDWQRMANSFEALAAERSISALGARVQDVLAHVLRRGLATVAAGITLGLLGTLAATRAIESMLFELSAQDPLALALACASIAMVGLLAGLVPARRAAAVAPATALRED